MTPFAKKPGSLCANMAIGHVSRASQDGNVSLRSWRLRFLTRLTFDPYKDCRGKALQTGNRKLLLMHQGLSQGDGDNVNTPYRKSAQRATKNPAVWPPGFSFEEQNAA
jgi:hypothetical protein